jgi:hypothetical protein
MRIRCKFRVSEITPSDGKAPEDSGQFRLKLYALYESEKTIPEDEAFTKYTPSGEFSAHINNPNVVAAVKAGEIKVGSTFYLDLTPVE